jgi:hypothetical protein
MAALHLAKRDLARPVRQSGKEGDEDEILHEQIESSERQEARGLNLDVD